MGATVIVLDTNQFRSSPMLRSSDWTELVEKADEWGLRFAVPEVCLMEAVSVVPRKWREQRTEIGKLAVGEFGLGESQSAWLDTIDSKIDGYEEAIRERLAEMGAEIVPIPESVEIVDLVKRAIDRRRPNPDGEGKKDGFRDTLIWLTTQRIAADDGECEVWLISTNHNDFGNKAEADGDESCPYPLHPHLVEEIDMQGLSGRVLYVRTIGRLKQHLAATYDVLSANDRKALIEQLDRSDLERSLVDSLQSWLLDPAATALPLRTVEASINTFACRPESLQFIDAAMRGGGAWTAQFHQTIDASIDITEMTGDTATLDKTLEVAGRLAAGADGVVRELIVTSVEARSDDPMRRAWDRSAPDPKMVRDYLDHMPSMVDILAEQIRNTPSMADMVAEQMKNMPSMADMVAEQMKNMPSMADLVAEQIKNTPSMADVMRDQIKNLPSVADMVADQMKNLPSVADMVAEQMKNMPSMADILAEQIKNTPSMISKHKRQKPNEESHDGGLQSPADEQSADKDKDDEKRED